jgi:autotransporter translocation and assembly factor TamB
MTTDPMRGWMRRGRVLLVVVGLLLGAAAGAAWVLFQVYGPDRIRTELERALSTASGRPARVEAVTFRPWLATLRVSGVRVADDGPAAGGAMVSLDHADIGIRLESLWRRQLVLTVTLAGLDVTTSSTGRGGGVGLAGLALPSTFSLGAVEIRIGLIRLDQGHILHRDPGGGWAVEVRGLEADVWPEPSALRLSARAENLRVESPAGEERVERLRIEGSVQPGEIRLEPSRLRWQGHEIRLSGRLTQPAASSEVHASLQGELPLAAVGSRLGLGGSLSGLATIDAVLDGPPDALRVEARVTVPELGAGPVRARNVRLEGSVVDAALRVSDLRADLPGGTVTGALTVSSKTAAGARSVELTLDGVRLPHALAALGPGALRAEARIVGSGVELGPATARWADLRLDVTGQLGAGHPLALHANLDGDLGGLGRAMGSAPVEGRLRVAADASGTLERPVVTGRVEIEPLAIWTQPIGRVELVARLEGTDGLTRWTGTLDAGRVAAQPAPVEDLRAAFTLDADQLDLQRLTGRVEGVPLDLHGVWTWAGTGRAQANLGPVALRGVRGLPAELALAGTGSGRVEIAVGPGTSVAAEVGLTDVSLRDVALGTGRLHAKLDGRDLTADVAFPAARLSASARGRLEGGHTLAVQARIERFDLDPIVARLAPDAQPHLRATVSARAEAELPLDQLETARVTAWIRPDDLVVAGEAWTTRSPAVVRWDGERLFLEQLQVRGPLGTVSAEGAVDRRSGDGRLAVLVEDARLPSPLDRLGRGAVRGEARLTRTALEGVSLRARWPTWALTADGRIPFETPMALRSQLTVDVAELGRIRDLHSIAGQAVVSADIGGPWRRPTAGGRIEIPSLTVAGQALAQVRIPFQLTRSTLRIDHASALLGADPIALDGGATWADSGWRGQGTLSAPAVTVKEWPIQSPRIAFVLDADRLAVTDLALSVHGIPVQGTASWPWKGQGHLEARLGPGSMAGLPGLPPALEVEGTASGRIEATGRSLEDVAGRATLRLEQARAAGLLLGAGTLDLDLRGLVARADLRFPDRRLTVTAEGRAAADALVRVRAAIDDLALGELLRRFDPGGALPVEGTLSARVQAEVPITQPTAGRGTLRVDPFRMVVAGEALASREPIVALFDARGVLVDRLALQGPAGTITGRLGVDPGGRLDASLHGQTQLAFLASLRPEVEEASGTLDVTATVTGTTAAPVISGAGTVRGGSLRVRGYADPLRDIEAELTASRTGLRLTKAQAALGGGTITATGEAALTDGGLGSYQVALTARRVSVSPLEGLSTLWDGELELTGRGARGQLGGELRLVRGTYTRELAPGSSGRAPAAGSTEQGLALPLRVLVKLDDNLVVRNRTARLRIGGTLSVEGTTAAPAVLGVIETREGTVAFRNRRFTVVTASARFVDPRRIDPYVDAIATARIRDYDVTAQVRGRLDNLEVHLRSIPPLSQEDLLALVAFGATRAELERSPAGVIAGEAARTVVRDLLGLETLGGETGTGGLLGRLQVGTLVPDGGSAGESRGPEVRDSQRVRVEYQLLGPISLVGEQGQRGGYAAGVVLRLRFR